MNKLILIFRLLIIFLAININSQEIFVEYSQKIPGTNFLIEMAAIPGGEFKMGSPMNEKNRLADEGPQRKLLLIHFGWPSMKQRGIYFNSTWIEKLTKIKLEMSI